MTNEILEIPAQAQKAVTVGSRKIAYSEFGEGPDIIMLHGGGPGASGLSNYSRNIEALAREFRVIVPDLPGYGGSTKQIDKSDSFGDLASAMLGFMDALKIRRADLLGNSLGGATALRMAMDQPDRVRRLVLMGPGGIGTTRSLPTKGLNALLNYYGGEGPTRDKLAGFLREYLIADASQITEKVIDERFRASIDPDVVKNPPLTRPPGLRALWRMDLTRDGRLRALTHPTLVLWGKLDKVNRPSGGLWLSRNLPDCSLHLFANVGHWVQWERPGEFNAMVTTFLKQDDAA